MGPVVWVGADTLAWSHGGGYLWAALNWALGLRAVGCEVIWLESADPRLGVAELCSQVQSLKERLGRYGLADSVALCSKTVEPLPRGVTEGCIGIEAVAEADLLLNMSYDGPRHVLGRCHRTAMLDLDPGLTQVWISEGVQFLPPHDVYFTIGETVGRPDGGLPDGGVSWQYTPPCVALDWWPVVRAPEGSPFTTVSAWETASWFTRGDESYPNSKREGFLPFLDLPRYVSQPLELALCLAADEELRLEPDQEEERTALEERGWRVVHSYAVASTPWDYQRYVQNSRGEFSCAKPSGARLQNAWISDRTLCYLASGKPAVVQHTGPSGFLPEAAGLFRFHDIQQAASYLETIAADYQGQCHLARRLAEEFFDSRKVVSSLLELALG